MQNTATTGLTDLQGLKLMVQLAIQAAESEPDIEASLRRILKRVEAKLKGAEALEA